MNQKIGVLGGTFNPIHNGHLMIARCAQDQFDLDSVLFMPTGHTAYKDYAGEDMSVHRCRMVELAVAGDPRFAVCYDEIKNESVNYTYQTLGWLKEEYPDAQLFFILGGDSLHDLPIWRHPEIICEEAVILLAARRAAEVDGTYAGSSDQVNQTDDTDLLIGEMADRYGGDFRRIESPIVNISSTDIRQRVRDGLDISDMVPPAVADYIRDHGLYLE